MHWVGGEVDLYNPVVIDMAAKCLLQSMTGLGLTGYHWSHKVWLHVLFMLAIQWRVTEDPLGFLPLPFGSWICFLRLCGRVFAMGSDYLTTSKLSFVVWGESCSLRVTGTAPMPKGKSVAGFGFSHNYVRLSHIKDLLPTLISSAFSSFTYGVFLLYNEWCAFLWLLGKPGHFCV